MATSGDAATSRAQPPRIAIIVVGYDSGPDIPRLLASLPAGVTPHRPTLCLVDNASSDEDRGARRI